MNRFTSNTTQITCDMRREDNNKTREVNNAIYKRYNDFIKRYDIHGKKKKMPMKKTTG